MEVTTSRIDVPAYEGGTPPHDIIRRKAGESWLVSHEPIRMDAPVKWHLQTKEDHVYVPVCPYLVVPEPDLAMAFMLQIGMRVSFDVGRPVRRLHIVIGSPVNQVEHQGQNCWQVQYGFGIVV